MRKKTKFIPVITYNRNCPNCGNTRSIIFTNRFNDVVSNIPKANGVYDVRCMYCGYEYIIQWDTDGTPSIMDKKYSITNFEKYFFDHEKRDIDHIMIKDLSMK
jgi:transcription elongation factor Elf1